MVVAIAKYGIALVFLGFAVWFGLSGGTDLPALVERVGPATVFWVALFSVGSLSAAALRLKIIASDLGYALSLRQSLAAVCIGQVGGFLFFQLIGHLVARGAFLSKRNVPMAGTILITGSERIGAAMVSLVMAICGALYLYSEVTLNLRLSPIKLSLGVFAVVMTCGYYWREELWSAARSLSRKSATAFAKSAGMSVFVQLPTMAAYVVAAQAFAPEVPIESLAAASALIMFATAIPISVAGWGVRELSAIAALNSIGVPKDVALLVAVLVGSISMLASIVIAAIPSGPSVQPAARPDNQRHAHHETGLMAVLVVLVASLVFFNAHLPTESAAINLNLADPVAIVGGLLFLFLGYKNGLSEWRINGVTAHVLLCTAALTLALFIGAYHIGWTQWALANKYAGWFVLLAFAATGSFAVRIGLERALKSMLIAGSTVLAFSLASYVGVQLDILPGEVYLTGFADNQNAFAFQCLMLICVALAIHAGPLPVAIGLVALWLTSSRAGVGSAAILLIVASVLDRRSFKTIAVGLGIAVAMILPFEWAFHFAGAGCLENNTCGADRVLTGRQSSSNVHSEIGERAVELFLQHPIFGAGLGTFINGWTEPLRYVIHSTPLWLLAEFGILGSLPFFAAALRIFWTELRRGQDNDSAGRLLMLIMVAIGTMSLFHELLYQRIFWFLLGAALAMKFAPRTTTIRQASVAS